MTEELPPASFPNFAGKHDHDALFSPHDAMPPMPSLGDRILTVEMEASALYAVGKVRNVEVTGAFVVADVLDEDGWKPEGIGAAETRERLEQLLEASFAALR
jgi:purine-nucleoside phosphorylase